MIPENTWKDSQTICEEVYHGVLASIQHEKTFNKIQDLDEFENSKIFWMGSNNSGKTWEDCNALF